MELCLLREPVTETSFVQGLNFLLELRNIFLTGDRKCSVDQSRQHMSRLQRLVELTHSIFP